MAEEPLTIRWLQIKAGTPIETAAIWATRLSDAANLPLQFTYNGVVIVVHPGTHWRNVVEGYALMQDQHDDDDLTVL